MSGSAEVDLLGEPRLKNGLTYYPGVQTDKGSVILGNVVRLQLQAEGAQPYIGYGFLKGLWLWREQPYIRVQYMAPSSNELPKDAIAYRTDPDTSSMPELMVTNRVGDLHLNALLGPVFIEGGPLLSQLFQENIGTDADGFICSRHLDPAVQRVQPLDEAFRLTPIVQAFPKTVLRAILGAPSEEGAAGLRVPQCAASSPTSAPPLAMASFDAPPSAQPAAAAADPAAAAAADAAASSPQGNGPSGGALIAGLAEPPPPSAPAAGAPSTLPIIVEPTGEGPRRLGGFSGVPSAQVAPGDALAAQRDSPARGFGPGDRHSAILLNATYRGMLFRPAIVIRCPAERRVLTERLASIFGLVSSTVKVVFQQAPGEWMDLGAVSQMVKALEDQPELSALPIQVTGEEMLHLPLLHALASLISIANVGALAYFLYMVVYVPNLPAPWSMMVGLPGLLVLYNGYASQQAFTEEYLTNNNMRVTFARKDGWLVMLMMMSLLGPDTMVLFSRLQLPPLGTSISRTCEQTLTFWAFGLHVVQDAPALALNMLMHKRLNLEWDTPSLLLLGCTALSLTYNFVWHVMRMVFMRGDEEDETGGLVTGLTMGDPSITKRRTMRKLDTSKYVGLGNTAIIGNVGGAAMYEA